MVSKIINCPGSRLANANNPEVSKQLQLRNENFIMYTFYIFKLNKHLNIVLEISSVGFTQAREPFLCVGCHHDLQRHRDLGCTCSNL